MVDFIHKNDYNESGDYMKKNNVKEFETGSLFKIMLVICIVFAIFYVLTYYISKKTDNKGNNTNTDTVTVIQYDEILIGSILNQPDDSYYVLITSEYDYTNRYKEYISKYSNGNKIYYSFKDNQMNNKYISENENLIVENISDFKVKDNTLLKIVSGKIVNAYSGNQNIMNEIVSWNN